MKANTFSQGRTKKKLSKTLVVPGLALAAIFLIAAVALVRPLRSQARSLLSLGMGLVDSPGIKGASQGNLTNVLFLHHSTGELMINQGGMREQMAAKGLELWDHGYNWQGIRGPDGRSRGYSYRIPNDNTDPDWLAVLFEQKASAQPVNAFSGLLQHEVIIIKSCFTPTSHIPTDAQLETYQSYYLRIRETIDQHPDKLFIIMTQPPLNPAETNTDEAVRARALSDWLVSEEFLEGRKNLYAFNTFNHLIDNNPESPTYNMLREEYRNGGDSHPNQTANQQIVPLLVDFISQTIDDFKKQ